MEPRHWLSGASVTPPAAPATPSNGYPTGGDPATATPATNPGPHWFYKIAEELRNVIVGAGLTPSDTDLTQLRQSLSAAGVSGFKVLQTGGVPYGLQIGILTIQFGFISAANGTYSFPQPFAHGCIGVLAGNASSQGTSGNDNAYAYPLSTTQFKAACWRSDGAGNSAFDIFWIAVGY